MNSILKKSLSFLMVFCMMFLTVVFTVGAVSDGEEVYKTWEVTSSNSTKISSYTSSFTTTVGSDKWTVKNGNNNNLGWNYVKFGRKNYASVGEIFTQFAVDEAISSVSLTVTAGTWAKINSVKLVVASNNAFSADVQEVPVSVTKAATYEVVVPTPAANMYYKMVFDCASGSSNGLISVSKITLNKQIGGADSTEPRVSISATNANAYIGGDTVKFTATTTNLDGVAVEWVSSNEEVATILDGVLTGLTMGTTKVKAVCGEVESSEIEIKVFPKAGSELTIAQALEVCKLVGNENTLAEYTVYGTVKSVDEAYTEQYKNMTLTLTDGTNSIKVFRLTVNTADGQLIPAVGDKIYVTGNLINYNGNTPEFAASCTFVQYVTVTFMNEGLVWDTVEVEAGKTVAEPEGLVKEGYNLLGWLNGEFAWDFEDAVTTNLTLEANWVSTALEVYNVIFNTNGGNGEFDAQEVAEGSLVVNPGNPTRAYATFLGWFNGDQEWDFEVDTPTEDIELVAKWDVLADSVIEFVETETKASLNFGYTVSGEVAAVAEEETPITTFEFGTNDTSKTNEGNQDGNSASTYSETVGGYTLTLSSMSKVYKGSYDAKGNACLKLGTNSAAGSFSFTVDDDIDYVIIKVAGYKANNAKINVNETEYTVTTQSAKGEYTDIKVDTTATKTVTFKTVSGGYRCKITSIAYFKAAPTANYTFNDVAMRFQGALDAQTYEALVAEGSVVKFGIAAAKVAKLSGQTLFEAIDAEDANAKFIECTPTLTEEGDTYLFALLLTGIPTEAFAEEVVAAAYVEVDGVKHYMTVKQFSVNSLAQYYVNNLSDDETVAPHVEALKALAKAN